MVQTKERVNPLKILFEMDKSVLQDPRKLEHVVRGVRRALQTTYHPDRSASGDNPPFSWEEANRLSARINSSEQIEELESYLRLLAGEREEKYTGEKKEASAKVHSWVEDYQNPVSDTSETARLRAQLDKKAKRMRQLERERNDALRQLRDVEIKKGVEAAKDPDLPTKVKGGVESCLAYAEKRAIDSNMAHEGYERSDVKKAIDNARSWARVHPEAFAKVYGDTDFDKVFGSRLKGIGERYISQMLRGESFGEPLSADMYAKNVDAAVEAAKELGLQRALKSKIKEGIESYMASLSNGKRLPVRLGAPGNFEHDLDRVVAIAKRFRVYGVVEPQLKDSTKAYLKCLISENRGNTRELHDILPGIIRLSHRFGIISPEMEYSNNSRYSRSHGR